MPTREDKLTNAVSASAGVMSSTSVIPLHHQLYIALRQRLIDGAFPEGKPLPGELRLAEEFGVSRVTLRRTLDSLQNEGLIVRKHGVGTFPAKPASAGRAARPARGPSYSDHVYSTSREVRHELVEFDYIPTPHFLDSSEDRFGAVVLKTARTGYVRKQPVHLVIGYTPSRLGQLFDSSKLSNRPLMELLQKSGITIVRTDLIITACAADTSEATLLMVPIGSPLIRTDRTSWNEEGQPVQRDVIYSRPDLFHYSFVSDQESGTLRPGPVA